MADVNLQIHLKHAEFTDEITGESGEAFLAILAPQQVQVTARILVDLPPMAEGGEPGECAQVVVERLKLKVKLLIESALAAVAEPRPAPAQNSNMIQVQYPNLN